MRWMLLVLLLASAAGAVEPPRLETAGLETPRLEAGSGSRLVLTGLPPILADEEVKEHLTTGLTTTLQFRVGGNKLAGGARVEIRYDLWDEVFLVKAGGIDGRAESYRASSLDELMS